VHGSPSRFAVPGEQAPLVALHAPGSWHSSGGHCLGVPMHAPALQRSSVHGLPSLQLAVSLFA
jgi:hypothetical protein